MKIHSIHDVPAWLFYPLKTWADKSLYNYHILLTVIMLFVIASLLGYWFMYKKIGKTDERTNSIYLRAVYVGFTTLVICDIFFPDNYLIEQFKVLKYGFSMAAMDIDMWIAYRRGLS